MTPQPATAMHLALDPATTDETLATIFGALRRNPERTPAQHQTQRDAGALMLAALHPSNPIEAAYAVRATAAHFASMECFRRTTIPDTPDNVGQRWFGKALALSRMSTDMIDALTDSQEAAPHAHRQPAVRPDDRLSQALAAEVARRAAAARAKAAETPASPAATDPRAVPSAPDRRNPKPSERSAFTQAAPAVTAQPAAAVAAKLADGQATVPSAPDPRAGPSVSERRDPKPSERSAFTQAAPAVTAQPAAAAAAKLADMPAGPSAPDPKAGPAVSERRNPLSSERPTLPPAASAIVTCPAAVSCLAPTLPRPGLRAGLLSSTSLSGLSSMSSGVVPVPAAPPVTPAKLAGA